MNLIVKSGSIHPLDPNFLSLPDSHEHRIYADDYAHTFARVDAEDYWFFSRWRWKAIPNSTGKKLYLIRTTNSPGDQKSYSIYLHVAIHERRQIRKPTRKHTMVDHVDSDSLHCRKINLRWATPQMNRWNRAGQKELGI